MTIDDLVNNCVGVHAVPIEEFSDCVGDFMEKAIGLFCAKFAEIREIEAMEFVRFAGVRSLAEVFRKVNQNAGR